MRGGEEVEGAGVATWGHNPDDWAAVGGEALPRQFEQRGDVSNRSETT
jgi:hypothetical protein